MKGFLRWWHTGDEMRKSSLILTLVSFTFASIASLSAQTPIFMKAGYTIPTPIRVASGQVITLYVSGTKTVLPPQNPSIQATTTPLPTMLGGFSVTVRQGNNTYPAPLFSVVQTPDCTDTNQSTPGCIVTALTVQIPFEITPLSSVTEAAQLPGDLSVNDNGAESAHIPILPAVDNIHVLTTCELPNASPSAPLICPGAVTHADGTIVSVGHPAKAGEVVVIYAYGLGATTPAVKTGDVTPTPAPVLLNGRTVMVQYDFRPNAGPAVPYLNPLIMAPFFPGAIFAGLTPGQVGLYQLNVQIPQTIPSVPSCTGAIATLGNPLTSLVISNLTIDLAGVNSFDGAAICVQPPQ
jgi:uncharacterized protein (TIGR03437 family)